MTNKYRSERIFIFGGKAWILRVTMQIIAELEGSSGMSLATLIEKIRANMLKDSDYSALEQVIRRNLAIHDPFPPRIRASFKKQIRALLLEIFCELNPQYSNIPVPESDFNSLDIPWNELMYICVYHLKIPFGQFWNLTLPEVKVLLSGLGGTVYPSISPAEIKEMRDILKTA